MSIKNFKKIAVMGAGIMGHGIAQVCAEAGYQVYLRDIEERLLQEAMKNITLNLEKSVHERLTDDSKVSSILSCITTTVDINEAVSDVDVIFEAVPERMDLKKEVWRDIDRLCPSHAIMASNTSSFSITELASATKRLDRFVGVHWMLPPHIRPLVEIVRGDKTSDETIDLMKKLFKKMGKVVIVCNDSPGFIVNRLQAAMISEAISLVENGICSMEDIDLVWTNHLGHRYCIEGPFQFIDRSGLDTWYSIFQYLYNELKDPKFKPPNMLKQKVDVGELGLKSGKGVYDYTGRSLEAIIANRDKKLLRLLETVNVRAH